MMIHGSFFGGKTTVQKKAEMYGKIRTGKYKMTL